MSLLIYFPVSHTVSCFDTILPQKLIISVQAKRSSVKLDIYRKFSNALAVTVVASVAWIGYEVWILI